MSKYLYIVLCVLVVSGCFRSEIREARRERPALREVFPPPTLEQGAPSAAAEPPASAGANAGGSAVPAATPGDNAAASADLAAPALDEAERADEAWNETAPGDSLAPLPNLEDEFTQAQPAMQEAEDAAAQTAARDIAAAAAEAARESGSSLLDEPAADTLPAEESAPMPAASELDEPSAALPPASTPIAPASPPAAEIQPLPATDAGTPPRIVFSTRPAILVPLYGAPRLVPVEGTALTRIENTPAIVLKGKSGNYYVPVYDGFMQSKQLSGTWAVTKPIPKVLYTGKEQALKAGQQDLFAARPHAGTGRVPTLAAAAPRVIVSSQPTALVLVDGQPGYQAVRGTQLSRLVNTDSVVYRNDADGHIYLLVGDRWYRAGSTSGPWTAVPTGTLPADIVAAMQAAQVAR
ncbi:MAG: hypothetical protein KIS79_02950 [Burkholderiales bacterium]|nr:hypothetical protein [Burkholderiales bacterium]